MGAFLMGILGILLMVPLYFGVRKYGKALVKHERKVYLGVLILVLLMGFFHVVLEFDIPVLDEVIAAGPLSFALFALVMFAGALKPKSNPKKTLLYVRRPLAMLGFLFLIPHLMSRLALALGGYNTSGLVAFVLMIPLIVTSWPSIRKQLKPGVWAKVHRLAYVVYLVLYFHLAFDVSFTNGTLRFFPSPAYVWFYHALFAAYLGMKFYFYILPQWQKRKAIPNQSN
jgi:DMSO/TMAO reductase YedYZ heme-binding membrane subunit